MELRRFRATCPALATASLLVLVACTDDDSAMGDAASGPSIEGSYRLVARDLPGGTTLEPPEIFGLMTFTGGLRHFHIHTPVIGGTGLELYNLVAEYELTGDTYTETRLYDVTSGSTGSPTYQLTGQPVSSAVTVDSGTVTFDEPNDGPELAFTPTGLTATLEGAFVDHWEKIE